MNIILMFEWIEPYITNKVIEKNNKIMKTIIRGICEV